MYFMFKTAFYSTSALVCFSVGAVQAATSPTKCDVSTVCPGYTKTGTTHTQHDHPCGHYLLCPADPSYKLCVSCTADVCPSGYSTSFATAEDCNMGAANAVTVLFNGSVDGKSCGKCTCADGYSLNGSGTCVISTCPSGKVTEQDCKAKANTNENYVFDAGDGNDVTASGDQCGECTCSPAESCSNKAVRPSDMTGVVDNASDTCTACGVTYTGWTCADGYTKSDSGCTPDASQKCYYVLYFTQTGDGYGYGESYTSTWSYVPQVTDQDGKSVNATMEVCATVERNGSTYEQCGTTFTESQDTNDAYEDVVSYNSYSYTVNGKTYEFTGAPQKQTVAYDCPSYKVCGSFDCDSGTGAGDEWSQTCCYDLTVTDTDGKRVSADFVLDYTMISDGEAYSQSSLCYTEDQVNTGQNHTFGTFKGYTVKIGGKTYSFTGSPVGCKTFDPNEDSTTFSSQCALGDIYYSDQTCSSGYSAEKTPIGVVFMLTDSSGNIVTTSTSEHGRIINLHDLYAQSNYLFNASKPYSGSYNRLMWGLYKVETDDIVNFNIGTGTDSLMYALQKAKGKESSADIYNGAHYTDMIDSNTSVKCTSYTSGTAEYARYCRAPAAEATMAFYPTEALKNHSKFGAGNWYLPTMGEWAQLYGVNVANITDSYGTSGMTGTGKTLVDNALSLLEGQLGSSQAGALTNNIYVTSTGFKSTYSDNDTAWGFLPNGTVGRTSMSRGDSFYVRAVAKF
jgi:hypothetical protein